MPTFPATITLKGIWAALIAAAFAILLALLAVQTVRIEGFKIWPLHWEGWKPKAERLANDLKAADTRLAASNASIDRLQAVIAANNARIEQQGREYAAAKQQAEAGQAKLAEQAKSSDQRIAALRALAAKASGKCGTPDDLAKLAEGL